VTKSQIFNSVYGLFDQEIDENVIESHISKLRRRLRGRLGYDPIDSKRHLGYRLISSSRADAEGMHGEIAAAV
jgi:DNA-binding response OmpR family regulator